MSGLILTTTDRVETHPADLLTVANLRSEEYRDSLDALSKAGLLTAAECWTADRALRTLAALHEHKQAVVA